MCYLCMLLFWLFAVVVLLLGSFVFCEVILYPPKQINLINKEKITINVIYVSTYLVLGSHWGSNVV